MEQAPQWFRAMTVYDKGRVYVLARAFLPRMRTEAAASAFPVGRTHPSCPSDRREESSRVPPIHHRLASTAHRPPPAGRGLFQPGTEDIRRGACSRGCERPYF